MGEYSLSVDGDGFEKSTYELFLNSKFPNYENFWNKFVVPLTNRPTNVFFKNDTELQKLYPSDSKEKIHERICIAQLHYSSLIFLRSAFDGCNNASINFGEVVRCFSNLYSALDISAELFGRYDRLQNNGVMIDNFDQNSVADAIEIRKKWQKNNGYPLKIKAVRDYRDNLIHGRAPFTYATPEAGYLALPIIGQERSFFDWRKCYEPTQLWLPQYEWTHSLTVNAFNEVVNYLNIAWNDELL